VTVATPDAATCSYVLTPANNTFSNTCPLMINYHSSGTTGQGIVPVNTLNIVAGLYIASPPTTSFAGINLAASIIQHPLSNCRLYYSRRSSKIT
jgi:hypothetical protein